MRIMSLVLTCLLPFSAAYGEKRDVSLHQNEMLKPTGKWTAFSQGNADLPPMGWNSWNAFRTDVNEQKVMGAAKTIVATGLAQKGYKYINIDDGWWLKRRSSDGRIEIRTSIFPSADRGADKDTSFRPFVDQVHSMGLKAGIYSEIGKNACSQVWDLDSPNLPEGNTSEREIGLWGHVNQDIALFFEEWGFDYVKVDACGVADYDASKPFVEKHDYNAFEPMIVRGDLEATDVDGVKSLYHQVAQSLQTSNPDGDFILSICTWGTANVRVWGKDQGNLWRTSEDIRDTWDSMLHVFDSAVTRALFAGPGTWNDPDMLYIGHGDFDESHLTEARSHFTLWSMIAAPLMIGFDLRDAPQSLLDIWGNDAIIAINQDPAGNQGVLVKDDANLQIIVKGLADFNQKAVALFNRSAHKQEVTLHANQLGFDPAKAVKLVNLWDPKDSQILKGNKSFTIAPHQTLVFKASGQRELAEGIYLSEIPGRINVAVDGVPFTEISPEAHRTLALHKAADKDSSGFRQDYPGFGGPRVNHTPYGKKISLNRQSYNNGIGILANSRLEVRLDKEFTHFTTTVGIDDSSLNKQDSVVFSLFGDGRKLAESEPVSHSSGKATLAADINGVEILELITESSKKSSSPTITAWAEPVLN